MFVDAFYQLGSKLLRPPGDPSDTILAIKQKIQAINKVEVGPVSTVVSGCFEQLSNLMACRRAIKG